MLTVHHLGISQSERIVWLCEELGIPYELKRYDRDKANFNLAPAEYKALHKQATAPIITDGDLVLPESGAIVEYIIHKYGGGRLAVGPGAANYADYLYWFHIANGMMMPNALMQMLVKMAGGDIGRLGSRISIGYELVEERLGRVPYFAGDELTAADIMMGFSLTTMRLYAPQDISNMPNLRSYLARIGARPAYQTAMKKADPTLRPVLS
jgi:glutathione S-transferase